MYLSIDLLVRSYFFFCKLWSSFPSSSCKKSIIVLYPKRGVLRIHLTAIYVQGLSFCNSFPKRGVHENSLDPTSFHLSAMKLHKWSSIFFHIYPVIIILKFIYLVLFDRHHQLFMTMCI